MQFTPAVQPALPRTEQAWCMAFFEGKLLLPDGEAPSLLAAGGIYARLWAHQSGGFLGEEVDDDDLAPPVQPQLVS